MPLPARPGLRHERELARAGYAAVAGVDEAGRGTWAGPVTAGIVILSNNPQALRAIHAAGVTDSKKLGAGAREACREVVLAKARAWAVAHASAQEIDALGIVPATRLAMRRAITALTVPADALIIDAVKLPGVALPQRSFNFADSISLSVACASILAKTERDRAMIALDALHPGYGFATHKGYGTAAHAHALASLGVCEQHRRTFKPIASALMCGPNP